MKELNKIIKVSILITVGIVLLNLIINFGRAVQVTELLERIGITFIYSFVLLL